MLFSHPTHRETEGLVLCVTLWDLTFPENLRERRENREHGKHSVRLVLIMLAQICRRFGILITFKGMILTNNSDLNTQEVLFHHVKLAVCNSVLVNWLWLENKWCLISFIQYQRLC